MRSGLAAAISRRRFLGFLGAGLGLEACAGHSQAREVACSAIGGRPTSTDILPLEPGRFTRSAAVFGAEASIILIHEDVAEAARAMDLALAELRQVEEVMSLYRPDSALCRLNREGVLNQPHPFLVEVMNKARQLSELTGGAFDVTVQPLWQLYAAAKQAGRLPLAVEIEAARRKVDWRKLEITPDRIRLGERGMAVTLNAQAQGYAADRVLACLRSHSIRHVLVNTGEIGAMGHKEANQPWSVGIQHPRKPGAYAALATLKDCCMATSGDYATRFSDDYLRHHIFDPATGQSPRGLASVTVTAATGLDADGLATAIMVVGRERGLNLLHSFPGAEVFLITKDGRTIRTARFPIATIDETYDHDLHSQ